MKKLWVPLALLLLAAVVGTFAGILYFRYANRSELLTQLEKGETVNILFTARGGDDKSKKLTVISVVQFRPKTNKIGFYSFFPQLRLSPDSSEIQEVYSNGGIEELKDLLSTTLDMPIEFTLDFDDEDLIRIIDLSEGVPWFLNTESRLPEENLPTGEFVLDGSMLPDMLNPSLTNSTAAAYQLYRYYSLLLNAREDSERIMHNLMPEKVFEKAATGISGSMSLHEMRDLLSFLASDKRRDLMFLELPVKIVDSKFILDRETAALYLGRFNQAMEKPFDHTTEIPKMEIKNGTYRARLARKLREKLTRLGLRVLEFTNADRHDYAHSILLDIGARPVYADHVASQIGISKVYHLVNRSLFTDLILIVGEDYKNLNFYRENYE